MLTFGTFEHLEHLNDFTDKMSSSGDYDVVTEIWSDNILQMAKLGIDNDESEDEESPCFTDEFVAKIDEKEELRLFVGEHTNTSLTYPYQPYQFFSALQKTTTNRPVTLLDSKFGEQDCTWQTSFSRTWQISPTKLCWRWQQELACCR